MLTLTEMVILALFANGVLEYYRHGSIFELLREKLSTGYYGNFVASLAKCGFCRVPWVAGATVLLWAAAGSAIPYLSPIAWFLLHAGALTRAASLIHDITWSVSRTPGAREER